MGRTTREKSSATNHPFPERVLHLINILYEGDERVEQLVALLTASIAKYFPSKDRVPVRSLWTEKDQVLITYGDQITDGTAPSIGVLQDFLEEHSLHEALNSVHILPFYPFSSDDGFAVKDYYEVRDDIGSWQDFTKFSKRFDLMYDYVVNHSSSEGIWFRKYLAQEPGFEHFFMEADPKEDLSLVTRPRSTPLLTEFKSAKGPKWVWTTFGPDQVDFNFGDPHALSSLLDVLLFYVAQGARYVRLDAVNYIWKELGTTCSHHVNAHLIVKIMRELTDFCAPGTILISETNVPHEENISYFGDADEAHLVYNFTLPPLLLDALLSHDGGALSNWARTVSTTRSHTNFFNFVASHDGIGVRSLLRLAEMGVLPNARVEAVMDAVLKKGGQISMRSLSDGSLAPYELNISLFSLLGTDESGEVTELSSNRFLTAYAICLALRGIPAIYFHSLVGTENDLKGVELSGRARSINRKKYRRDELCSLLKGETPQAKVFAAMKLLLRTRATCSALHPDNPQKVLDWGTSMFVIERSSSTQRFVSVSNLSPREIELDQLDSLGDGWNELLGLSDSGGRKALLKPFQTRWFSNLIK